MECEIVHYEDNISLFYFKLNQQPLLRPNYKETNRDKFTMNNPRKAILINYYYYKTDSLKTPISPIFYNQKARNEWYKNNKSYYKDIKWKYCCRDDIWEGNR